METSKTFGICSSHKFLNTNKSPICLFKISIISFFRILLENKSLPLCTHPILKVFQNQVTKFLLEKSKSLRTAKNFDI